MDLRRLVAEAIDLARRGDFGERAVEVNTQIIELDPASTGARTRLGRCYEEAGQLEQAAAIYRETLDRDANNTIAKNRLSVIEKARRFPGVDGGKVLQRSVHQTFTGFSLSEFAELGLCDEKTAIERFSPRIAIFMNGLNDLPAVDAIRTIREETGGVKGTLFRSNTLHAQPGHLYWYHWGGRWEPQLNLGLLSASHWPENHLRIGIGFNLTAASRDRDAGEGQQRALAHFANLQKALGGTLGGYLRDWLRSERGFIQHGDGGPDLDRTPADAVKWLIQVSQPARVGWVFFGKWLTPARPADVAILTAPKVLLSTCNQVFRDLQPLWKASFGKKT